MWVVVLTRAVSVVTDARLAALQLDGRVPDSEPPAEPALQAANSSLRTRQGPVVDDHVAAERRFHRGKRPDVEVVDGLHVAGAHDLRAHGLEVDSGGRPLEQDVDRGADHTDGAKGDQGAAAERYQRIGGEPAREQADGS